MDGTLKPLLILVTLSTASYADPNFKNIFRQTTNEAKNEVLDDITGKVPEWLMGDFVRQICASYGEIDGKLLGSRHFRYYVTPRHFRYYISYTLYVGKESISL